MDHRDVAVPPGHQRALLSALLLSAGRPVANDTLATHLWGDRPPANVRATLSTYVTRLRGVLGKSAIVTYPGGGYQLTVDEDGVDLYRFRRLLRQAQDAPTADAELDLLRQALGLWRGRPFTGVASDWLDHGIVPLLTEEWFAATERRIDLEIAKGAFRELIAQLSELTSAYPLRESLWSRLIEALRRSGRRADALAAYQHVRATLREELGIEPGEKLQAVHQRVLRDLSDADVEEPDHRTTLAPHQLPPDNVKFVGRTDVLAQLERMVDSVHNSRDGGEQPTVIVAIDGAPGIGKTTLAVHWAHRMVDRYPDAQIYLNLRGHSGDDQLRPSAAIGAVLRSLGVPTERIPADLDERTALLRSTLAGRRSLVLLDDARDARQVRALCPSDSSLVIVTSRNQLRELSIRDGAERLSLPRLCTDDAVDLLGAALGSARVAAEPLAAKRLAELCGGVPLALVIVAEHAQRASSLGAVAQILTDEMNGPDAFGSGVGKELYAALSRSYRNLGPTSAAMFRRLGVHPAGSMCVDAAAAVADLGVAEARQVLDQLVDEHLVEQPRPDRYELHDLIRLYAAEEARRNESAKARRAALHRVLDWYLHAAVSADSVLRPGRHRDVVSPFAPRVAPPRPADQHEAIAWFEREFDVLQAVVRCAATHGWGGHAWRIVLAMATFLDHRVAWHESTEIFETAFQSGEMVALASLGTAITGAGHAAP